VPTRTVAEPEIGHDTQEVIEPLYHVIILNDDEHTFEYVIEMLMVVFGMSAQSAFSHTAEADANGSSIVFTGSLKEAEHKRDMVHAYGPDWRMPRSRGSVAALVEPAL
jgi:ATP-dependent Clp protease adaptor protein ClpS